MGAPNKFGHSYRRKLPHFRTPGAIYHVRLHVHPSFRVLRSADEYGVVQNSILFEHKKICIVIAFAVMPTHAHIVLQPLPRTSEIIAWCDYRQFYRVEDILGSIKKFTARRINRIHSRAGKPFWEDESFDRTVRNEKDLDTLVDYIDGNPVRWGLAARPEDYQWSSASTIYSGKEEYRNWFTGYM